MGLYSASSDVLVNHAPTDWEQFVVRQGVNDILRQSAIVFYDVARNMIDIIKNLFVEVFVFISHLVFCKWEGRKAKKQVFRARLQWIYRGACQ